ncbi:hypothetical protein MVEN_02565500 [Mycena venus]|uniref:Uncharacterized protein n=1 Tax=Mycena venus TaxID=2733690 RepID=A0A8H6U3W4_9AGAR|nr:hypothetical protein MVEN_02565500 [Mycena venus]
MPNRTWSLQRDPDITCSHWMSSTSCIAWTYCASKCTQHTAILAYPSHIRPRIGAIRQALMSSADVSTLVWQWSEELQQAEQMGDIVHICGYFDRIGEWASRHTFVAQKSDFDVYVEDNLDVLSIQCDKM